MRTTGHRLLSPPLFGLTLFLFSLPFVTISCPGFDAATLTGTELALGTTMHGQDIEPAYAVLGALTVALLGLVIAIASFRMRHRGPAFATGVLGALGVMLLILFRAQMNAEITAQEIQIASARLREGYWLCLGSFSIASLLGFFCGARSLDRITAEAKPGQAATAPPPSGISEAR